MCVSLRSCSSTPAVSFHMHITSRCSPRSITGPNNSRHIANPMFQSICSGISQVAGRRFKAGSDGKGSIEPGPRWKGKIDHAGGSQQKQLMLLSQERMLVEWSTVLSRNPESAAWEACVGERGARPSLHRLNHKAGALCPGPFVFGSWECVWVSGNIMYSVRICFCVCLSVSDCFFYLNKKGLS